MVASDVACGLTEGIQAARAVCVETDSRLFIGSVFVLHRRMLDPISKVDRKENMLGSLKEEKVLGLINEAILQASTLGENSMGDIVSMLEKTRRVLECPVNAERDVPLMLSAAR